MSARRVAVGAVALAAATAGALGISAGLAGGSDPGDESMREIQQATRRYRDVDRATEAGYVQFFGCVHEPLAGSMGTHFVNAGLAGDTVLDVRTPEALVYETGRDGRLDLVAVEYVVFQAAWDAEHDAPPELFGHQLHLVPEPNRYGIPAFYQIHAWAWEDNPAGAHEDWNPSVLCELPHI